MSDKLKALDSMELEDIARMVAHLPTSTELTEHYVPYPNTDIDFIICEARVWLENLTQSHTQPH